MGADRLTARNPADDSNCLGLDDRSDWGWTSHTTVVSPSMVVWPWIPRSLRVPDTPAVTACPTTGCSPARPRWSVPGHNRNGGRGTDRATDPISIGHARQQGKPPVACPLAGSTAASPFDRHSIPRCRSVAGTLHLDRIGTNAIVANRRPSCCGGGAGMGTRRRGVRSLLRMGWRTPLRLDHRPGHDGDGPARCRPGS